jgi:hypothetical protein
VNKLIINFQDLYICVIINSLILLNYFFLNFNFNILNIIFILFILLTVIFYITYSFNKDFIAKIFILIIFIICLGTPLNDWDGKYIWLFHAKRIFFDNDLYAQLDNYMPWTHNDYPPLIPSLSASIANFFHIWNDNLPKLSSAVMLSTMVIFINSLIQGNLAKVIFFSLFLWITEKTFLSGSVDDILSSYTLCSSLIMYFLFFKEKYFLNNKKLLFLLSYIFFTLTTLIKNEGLVIIIVLFLSALFIKKIILNEKININIYLIFAISLIPIFIWKLKSYNAGIYSDIINLENIKNFKNRSLDLRSYWNIFNYMTLNKSLLLPILLFFTINFKLIKIISKKKLLFIKKIELKKITPLLYVIFFSLFYYLIIFFIYLSTPNDLIWHLSTSAYRVVMPIGGMLVFYSLINLNNNKLSR